MLRSFLCGITCVHRYSLCSKSYAIYPSLLRLDQFVELKNLPIHYIFIGYSHSYSTTVKRNSKMAENVFIGKKDRHGGITVNSLEEPCSSENSQFFKRLENSLSKWTEHGIRGVWFIVSLENAGWLPDLAKSGFLFHHGEGNEVTMYRWLPTTEPCGIPKYAHTMVGSGAIVLNAKKELLVVMEQNPVIKRWKLPGGYVEPGETIAEAAIREVYEETGIKTKFESLVAFRQFLKFVYGCADLYFVSELTPLTEEIVKGDSEIESCCWMKVEDFLSNPEISHMNKMVINKFLYNKEAGVKIEAEETIHDILKQRQVWYTNSNSNFPRKIDT